MDNKRSRQILESLDWKISDRLDKANWSDHYQGSDPLVWDGMESERLKKLGWGKGYKVPTMVNRGAGKEELKWNGRMRPYAKIPSSYWLHEGEFELSGWDLHDRLTGLDPKHAKFDIKMSSGRVFNHKVPVEDAFAGLEYIEYQWSKEDGMTHLGALDSERGMWFFDYPTELFVHHAEMTWKTDRCYRSLVLEHEPKEGESEESSVEEFARRMGKNTRIINKSLEDIQPSDFKLS